MSKQILSFVMRLVSMCLLAACATTDSISSIYEVSGRITGLAGSFLVLEDRGGTQQTFTADGNFTFNIRAGQPYDIIVSEQPQNPDQFCSVTNGTGVATQARSGITVTCRALAYRIGGRITGLEGSGLILGNGDDRVEVSDNDLFQMKTLVASSAPYEVRVVQQPQEPNQVCIVQNGKGVVSEFDINNITISCTTNLVNPLYPSHGRNWNDWVRNDGSTPFVASDTACTGDEVGRVNGCLHGGLMRTFFVPGETKCDGLSASDDRDALEWVCLPGTTPSTRFVSIGLKKHFSDLVNFGLGTLHQPVVTVTKDGETLLRTEPSDWWQNSLVNAGVNGGALTVSVGAIVIASTAPADPYLLTTSRVTFLVPPNTTLRGPNTGGDPILRADDVRFLWVEGQFDAVDKANAIFVNGGKVVTLRNLSVKNATGAGLNLVGVRMLQAKNVRVANNVIGALFDNVADANFDSIIASSNAGIGLRFVGLAHASLSRVLAVGNDGAGIEFSANDHDVSMNGVTLALNDGAGLTMDGPMSGDGYTGTHHRLQNVVAFNNNTAGISMSSTTGVRFFNLAATHHTGAGISGSSVADIAFSGLVSVGNQATSCSLGGVGLANDCSAAAPSTSVSTSTSASLANTFVGAISSNDSSHPTDDNGLVLRNAATDWFTFASAWRLLGRDFGIATADARSNCTGPSCRIFDFALASADSVARARNARPAANQRVTHQWSAGTKAACDKIFGATFSVNTCVSGFLQNAIERSFDAFGNDDGLCEANERCDYAPNLGSDQGVTPTEAEDLGAGQVSGVTLFTIAAE